jgi:uncharacterized membrane protein YphA (DoxX/SURF4 family)
VTIVLALLFLVEGGSKLLLDAGTVRTFHTWGYPIWLVFAVGLLEFPGALLILVPRLALLGAALMVIDMIGAIGTGVIQGIVPIILFSGLVLMMAALVGWTRRKRFVGWRLLQRPGLDAPAMEQNLAEAAATGDHATLVHQKEQAHDRR